MSENDDAMPEPTPIWLALGIVVWAVAEALEDGRGSRFVTALERRATEQAELRRIVPFAAPAEGRADLSRSARIARGWVVRLAVALRASER